jgi:hypothetical protein
MIDKSMELGTLIRRNKYRQIGWAVLLGSVLLVELFATMLAAILHIQQSPLISALLPISVSTILTLWVHDDSPTTGTALGLDQGMYIFFGWPITFPLHALRSRGFRSGGLLILALLGIIFIAAVTAVMATLLVGLVISISSAV